MKSKRIKKRINLLPRIKIFFHKKHTTRVLNSVISNNLKYIGLITNDNEIELEIYSNSLDKYISILKSGNIDYRLSEEYGILSILKKCKYRIGVVIGMALLVAISLFSTRLVWKININGNTKLSNDEIIEIMNESGLHLGTYIPSLDYDELHNKILLCTDKISWISVNIVGSVANVEVKEMQATKPNEGLTYTNIVSKYDGLITSVKIINGEEKIQVGDVVKAGDILISGVLDSQANGVRYVSAKGEVYAEVNKKIIVKVPKKNTENSSIKNVHTEKSIKIFSNIINFSLKHSNCNEFCDKIEKRENIRIFNTFELPISLITTKHYISEAKEITYSNQEMVDIAFVQLKNELDIALLDAELISKTINTYYDGECFCIECDLYCLENIAKEVEFFVEQ